MQGLEEKVAKLTEQLTLSMQVSEMLAKRLEELDPKHKGKMAEIRKVIMRQRALALKKEQRS